MPYVTHKDYIQALRSGDYRGFLQWPAFMSKRYGVHDADSLVDLLIFHWLQEGFCDEDARGIAAVKTLIYAEDCPLKNEQISAGVNLILVACQCLVFKKNSLVQYYCSDRSMGKDEILQLLQSNPHRLSDKENSRQLLQQDGYLNDLARKYSTEIGLLHEKMRILAAMDTYMDRLEEDELISVEDKALRRGIVLALQNALNDSEGASGDIQRVIKGYYKRLRCLEIQPWEESYFSPIMVKSWTERLLQVSVQVGTTFFQQAITAEKNDSQDTESPSQAF